MLPLIDLGCWTSAVPILENTCASSYEKHFQHFCMNSKYYLSLQYCSRVGRVRNVQPWFNSEDSWQIPKTHGWRPDNCQVLLCWVRPAQLQHMVEPSEPSVPEFFSQHPNQNIHIYIYTLGAPGFRKGWGGVGHVNVMFMVRWWVGWGGAC